MRASIILATAGLILALAAVCGPSAVSHAQDNAPGRKLAFLVGVQKYDHAQLKALDFPERDVEVFAEVLRKSGYTVVLLTTAEGRKTPLLMPTVENIHAQLGALLKKVTSQDMILIGLAGHGIQPLGSDAAYFCPKDANPTIMLGETNQPSRAKYPETLLGIDALLERVNESGIGRKLLLMDACRNDPGVRGRRGIDRVKVSALPQDTAVLLSCSPGQFAFEHKSFGGGHGAFFHHVIEGFQGQAFDADEEGVTWESLVKYVGKRVPATVKAQYGTDGGAQRPNQILNLPVESLLLAKIAAADRPRMSPSPAVTPVPTPGDKLSGAKAGEEWASNSLKIKFCWCPAGTFMMGSSQSETNHCSNEGQAQVTLSSGFWLGKFEVTQGEWKTVMDRDFDSLIKEQLDEFPHLVLPLLNRGDRYPMSLVRQVDATQFCKKLTAQEHAAGTLPLDWEFRLPTEAQWEYGCRSGTTTATAFGDTLSGKQANFDGERPYNGAPTVTPKKKEKETRSVGSFPANAWGLHDMHGNVAEWCRDYYAPVLAGWIDPEYGQITPYRTSRGGHFTSEGFDCRSAKRRVGGIETRDHLTGFRVALVQVKK